jgi:hypothetical protein
VTNPITKGKGKAVQWLRDNVTYAGDGCLLSWPFYRHPKKGYGVFGYNGKLYHAPRFMCELVNGPPPNPKHEAAHSCGNALLGCLAPNHLSWKTPLENAADKQLHGTAATRWGKQPTRYVLTADDVAKIRALEGAVTQRELANRFGVSENNIQLILKRKTWKDGTRRTGCFVKGDPNNPSKRQKSHAY